MAFEQYIAIIQQNKYVYSLTLLIVFYLLSKFAVFLSKKVILKITGKTKTNIDDLIVEKTNRPVSIILLLVGFRLALFPLGIKQNILDVLEHTLSSLIIIAVSYVVIAVAGIVIDNWGRKVAEKKKSTFDEEMI